MVNKFKNGVCALALFGIIGGVSLPVVPAYAMDQKTTDKVSAQVSEYTQEQADQKWKEISKEASVALQETRNSLEFLNSGNIDAAIASMEKATGKLDILLARNPELAFVPASVSSKSEVSVVDVVTAKRMVKDAKRLLDDGYVQEAGFILSNLVSQVVISVVSIPMKVYPEAMKEAASLVDDGKVDEAKKLLATTLGTLAIDVTIIPVPVANAKALLNRAEVLAETSDRTQAQNEELSSVLSAAKEQLELAQVLGYGKKSTFEDFYKEIKLIRKKTSDGKYGTGFFKEVAKYLTSITEDSQPESTAKN